MEKDKEEIRKWFIRGINIGALYMTTFKYKSLGCVYAASKEVLDCQLDSLNAIVLEIYKLTENMDLQLNAARAWSL